MSLIAIDIDGTWDQDPKLFTLFVFTARLFKHKIYFVTGAKELTLEKQHRLDLRHEFIYYTKGAPKAAFMTHQGIHIDIWIDNDPASITSQFIKPNTDHEL